jgi:hypothetical protein
MREEPGPDIPPTRHVGALLPEYLSDALDAETRREVRQHLGVCAACESELRAWERIGAIERERVELTPAPSLALLGAVFQRIDTEAAGEISTLRQAPGASVARWRAAHLWNIVSGQTRLLRRSVWVASAAGIAFATVFAASLSAELSRSGVLTIALPLIAAAGVAFLYGPENDPGLEITLATPTPARLVLLSRFGLLFAYDVALALLGTLALSLMRGDSLWGLAAAWLGPMALLSTASLALSLFTGPLVAAAGAALLWLAGALRVDHGLALRFTPEMVARMTPAILALSVGALLLALVTVSRREQFHPVDF